MIENCLYANNCSHINCGKDFCLRKYKLDNLYSAALLTDYQKKKTGLKVDEDGTDLEEFKTLSAIEKDILNFVNSGANLYIHSGQCGNGKTSWATRLIQSYINKIWISSDLECRALFISVPNFLRDLKDNISNRIAEVEYIKSNIIKADLVIWDDIAAKCGTEFEINYLLGLIDSRITTGKSNIYTSNLNKKEMFTALGERLTSRITNYSKDIELHGTDKRGIGGNN